MSMQAFLTTDQEQLHCFRLVLVQTIKQGEKFNLIKICLVKNKTKNIIYHKGYSATLQRWKVCETLSDSFYCSSIPQRAASYATCSQANIVALPASASQPVPHVSIWACDSSGWLRRMRMLPSMSPPFLCEKVSWDKCKHLLWLQFVSSVPISL